MGLAERYGPLSTRCALRVARAWAVLAVGLCMCGIGCTPLAVDAAASAAPLAARTLTVDVAKTTAPPPRRASHNWDAHVPRYFVAGAIAMEELNPLFTNSPAPPYMFQGRAYPQFRHLQAAGFGFCAQDYQQRSQRPCPNFASATDPSLQALLAQAYPGASEVVGVKLFSRTPVGRAIIGDGSVAELLGFDMYMGRWTEAAADETRALALMKGFETYVHAHNAAYGTCAGA